MHRWIGAAFAAALVTMGAQAQDAPVSDASPAGSSSAVVDNPVPADPYAEALADFDIGVHPASGGDWRALRDAAGVTISFVSVTAGDGDTVEKLLEAHDIHADPQSIGFVQALNPGLTDKNAIAQGDSLTIPTAKVTDAASPFASGPVWLITGLELRRTNLQYLTELHSLTQEVRQSTAIPAAHRKRIAQKLHKITGEYFSLNTAQRFYEQTSLEHFSSRLGATKDLAVAATNDNLKSSELRAIDKALPDPDAFPVMHTMSATGTAADCEAFCIRVTVEAPDTDTRHCKIIYAAWAMIDLPNKLFPYEVPYNKIIPVMGNGIWISLARDNIRDKNVLETLTRARIQQSPKVAIPVTLRSKKPCKGAG